MRAQKLKRKTIAAGSIGGGIIGGEIGSLAGPGGAAAGGVAGSVLGAKLGRTVFNHRKGIRKAITAVPATSLRGDIGLKKPSKNIYKDEWKEKETLIKHK